MIHPTLFTTADGSVSFFNENLQETYHSKHGAIQEAQHVFIKNGLFNEKVASYEILEIGFGTGLNAFLTLFEAQKNNWKVNYTALEAYPLPNELTQQLNYAQCINWQEGIGLLQKIHQADWEKTTAITHHFFLQKKKMFFENLKDEGLYSLIYFDAFGYRVQPELWQEAVFEKMYRALQNEGVLVTYACRNPIKRALTAVGFRVEKVPGPPGKREMMVAYK